MAGFRSGFVALVGRPNAGKSTLLNRLTGEKLAIVSPKPQTTRNRILGLLNKPGFQLALLDTPGIHKAKGELNRFMVEVAFSAIDEVDLVLLLVDASGKPNEQGVFEIGEGNRAILERLRTARKPVALALNKVDTVAKPMLLPLIDTWAKAFPFVDIFPISALDGEGVAALEEGLGRLMPEGEPLFPTDLVTDQAERFFVSELIREQILRNCREEIPYSTAVGIDDFDESEREPNGPPRPGRHAGLVVIMATIFVERDSQKAIVIGKGGQMLKMIGAASRREIEKLLGANVYLSLRVKVERRWSERQDALRKLGYAQGTHDV